MKPLISHTKKRTTKLGGFSSGDNLGGKVWRYRDKQTIYKRGAPAYTLFYIREGGVRLSNRTKQQPSAVTAILGVVISLASYASQAIHFVCLRPSR